MFISEILHHSIHEEEKNESLFTFLETALYWLDNHDEVANFHLILMLEATKYLGFYPNVTNIDKPFFDIKEGVFTPFQTISSLTEHETNLFKKGIALKFENNQKTFHVIERQIVLKILIDYYSFHLEGFRKPKSLEVLAAVFSWNDLPIRAHNVIKLSKNLLDFVIPTKEESHLLLTLCDFSL